ncbi:MAG: response regulator transcription factor [Cyanobacteria bacterium J06559_1]
MKVLIVEDDSRIARPLARDLRQQYHSVDIATDGMQGWHYAQSADYDLILLDLMLPKLDGISLCKRLRAAHCEASVLMLTAKDTTSDKVIGLDAGADDYLVKPFKLVELSARIRALQRRGRALAPPVLQHDKLQLNPVNRVVMYKESELLLTPTEHLLIEHFLRHPGQVLSRAALLSKLWDFDKTSGETTVKTHIANLRSKLKAAGDSKGLIETVYGVGYRLA